MADHFGRVEVVETCRHLVVEDSDAACVDYVYAFIDGVQNHSEVCAEVLKVDCGFTHRHFPPQR